jgi:hypothetical protein
VADADAAEALGVAAAERLVALGADAYLADALADHLADQSGESRPVAGPT